MIINKEYMAIMRSGKDWSTYEPRKHEYAGVVMGACMLLACIMLLVEVMK